MESEEQSSARAMPVCLSKCARHTPTSSQAHLTQLQLHLAHAQGNENPLCFPPTKIKKMVQARRKAWTEVGTFTHQREEL